MSPPKMFIGETRICTKMTINTSTVGGVPYKRVRDEEANI